MCDLWAGHSDLLKVCRKLGIRGGLKRVKSLFGIPRMSKVVEGRYALWLWRRYETEGDEDTLGKLLDCVNLEILETILDGLGDCGAPAEEKPGFGKDQGAEKKRE